MKILKYLCGGALLASCISGAWAKTGHGSSSDHQHGTPFHAQHHNWNKDSGFNPPRQLSPIQFEQLLQQNRSADSLYDPQAKQIRNAQKNNARVMMDAQPGCAAASDLQGLSGEALVNAVKGGDLSACLYGLFNTSWVGTSVFSDESIITIVNAINAQLANYDGTEATGAAELEKMVIYLRALHWAEWGNNRDFPAEYRGALENAFSEYLGGDHFVQFNGDASRNFMVRYELLILIRSSGTSNIPYIQRLTEGLLGYAASVDRTDDAGIFYQENGATQILTHLYNASENDGTALEQAVIDSPAIIANLRQFVETDGRWLLGHTREYQWADTVNELARFLRFDGDVAALVRPSVQAILNEFSHQGPGSGGWLNAQSAVTFYDAENCSLYGDACNFDLESAVLSGQHTCSDTLKLRYQEPISDADRNQICADLAIQEQEFHGLFGTTPAMPVEDDKNTALEVVIFSSYTDYDNYAGNFFGISTDNGGMYLEGSPWIEGNQARFIAHQATWLPDFQVWNLRHEYVHYLDGRFNKWGAFYESPVNLIWWVEGVAEYLSQPADNPSALAVATQGTYQLSELFQTTYANSNTARTYHWGYLASRFMIEENMSLIDSELLPYTRSVKYDLEPGNCGFDWRWEPKETAISNDWSWAYDDATFSSGNWVWTCGQPGPQDESETIFTAYDNILAGWGDTLDSDFNQWLACIVEGSGICQPQGIPGDLDGNNAVDSRDIDMFRQMLRDNTDLPLIYDFNNDGVVDRRDVRPMMALCNLSRCALVLPQ